MAFTDDFTGTAGQKLLARTGWSKLGSGWDADGPEIGAGNQLRAVGSDSPLVGRTEVVNHYIQFNALSGFASPFDKRMCAVVRASDRLDFYGVCFNSSDGRWEIYNPSLGVVDTWYGSAPSGDLVRIEATDNTILVKVNGIQRLSAADAVATNANVGLLLWTTSVKESVVDNWDSGALASSVDTTAPTLSAVAASVTGATAISGSVTTTEAGPAWAVLTTTATTPSAAQIKAGQNASGVASPAATATLVVGANTGVFAFTGLTASTGYYLHVVQDDTATPPNTATAVTAAMVTTSTPDTTAPTLSLGAATVKSNALIVLGTTTNEANGTMYAVLTTSSTPPTSAQVLAGQNNAGGAAAWVGNQAIASTGVKTFNATGLTANTAYYGYVVHRDASGNDSSVQSLGLSTTFRNGATGQWIIDHPGSFMAQCVQAGDEDAWFDWEQVTPPASGSWTEGPYADGTGVFEGPSATTMVILLRKDGATVGNFTVFLYDATVNATQGGAWSVSNLVAAAQTGAWAVRNSASVAQVGSWSVRNAVVVTQVGAWRVVNIVSATQTGAWSVQAAGFASAAQAGAWSVRNLISATQVGAWGVLGRVSATQVGAWTVLTGASVTQPGAWSVLNLVGSTQPGGWSVVALAAATQSGAWRVLATVISTQSGGWSIRNVDRIPSSELRRVLIESDGVGLLGKFSMQPGETLDYSFDFGPWLNDCSDTIDTHTITATEDMPVLETERIEGVIVALVSGTVDGSSHKLTGRIRTAGGRTKEAEISIRIKEF